MYNSKILITATLSLFALSANAEIVESGNCNSSGSCKYELDGEGNMRIYGSGELNGYPRFSSRDDIKSIVIEKGITTIVGSSFRHLSNLESVSIPNTVTSIGAEAFYGNGKLRNIVIPKSVTSIANSAFSYTRLTNVTIKGENVSIGNLDSVGYGIYFGNVNFNVIEGSETEKRLKELCGSRTYAKFHAYIPPKRTSYTIEEAMEHVNHTHNNTITFTFK